MLWGGCGEAKHMQVQIGLHDCRSAPIFEQCKTADTWACVISNSISCSIILMCIGYTYIMPGSALSHTGRLWLNGMLRVECVCHMELRMPYMGVSCVFCQPGFCSFQGC